MFRNLDHASSAWYRFGAILKGRNSWLRWGLPFLSPNTRQKYPSHITCWVISLPSCRAIKCLTDRKTTINWHPKLRQSKAIQLILQEAGRGGGKEAFGLLPSLLSFANGREKSVSIPTIGHLPKQRSRVHYPVRRSVITRGLFCGVYCELMPTHFADDSSLGEGEEAWTQWPKKWRGENV